MRYTDQDIDSTVRRDLDPIMKMINFKNKTVLDVGMGYRWHFHYLMDIGIDVWGIDKNQYRYCGGDDLPWVKDRMFHADIKDMPRELVGKFDIALQSKYQVFEDIPAVTKSIATVLKPGGRYIILSHDECYGMWESDVKESVKDCFNSVLLFRSQNNMICIAENFR